MNSIDPAQPAPHSPQQALVLGPSSGPIRVLIEQPSRFGRLGRWLLGTLLGISLLMNLNLMKTAGGLEDGDVQEKFHSLHEHGKDKIAIITVEGTILHSSDGFIKKQIDHAKKDDRVKAIVLRVDSPGGTVTGSDYVYHHLQELIKDRDIPMVVSMGGIAASGGYYVAMAAGDKPVIYAEPTTWTGSVGVIIPHYDLSELLSRWDVKDDSISSDPMKQMGSPTRKWSPEEREKEQAILKGLVDDSFARFKQIVLDSRAPLRESAEKQETVFTGRIFAADQAKANGLVDELGYLEDAIDRAIKLAGLKERDVRVVKYAKSTGLLDQLFLGPQGRARGASVELSALLDLTVPRAYYLSTWLPAVGLSEQQ